MTMPKLGPLPLFMILIISNGLEISRAFSIHNFKSTGVVRRSPLSLQKSELKWNQLPTYRQKTEISFFTKNKENTISEDSKVESNNKTPFKVNKTLVEKSSSPENYMDDFAQWIGKKEANVAVDDVDLEADVETDQSSGGLLAVGIIAAAGAAAIALGASGDAPEIGLRIQSFFADPGAALEAVVETVQSMGPIGYLYFGGVYTVAEILAIPAIPLTASAGYLFGVRDGTAVVLVSATIAAAVSFLIGRTFLRTYVEKLLESYPDFKKIDKAIGEEGFKLMLLLRLSPIFPFALSNYLYGVTSIRFWPFLLGTLLGFTPGTIAYVFTGEIGKSLTLDSATAEPWYVYAGALALLSGFIKIVSDVATGIIEKVQDDEDDDAV
jgi:uncharacterized membrane protein YdjX (TVP38/TMEM64 family)